MPQRRTNLMNSAFLFLLSLAGQLIMVSLLVYGYEDKSSAVQWSSWATYLIFGIALINVVSVFVFDVVLRKLSIPRILRDLIVAIAYIFLAIGLLTRVGVDLTGIVATSAVITAVIGFSLQDTLINLVGGISLEMENTINAGDWIRVAEFEGRVKEIRWRQTSIETRNWDTVVIPNSLLIKGPVVILGKRRDAPRQHRQWVYFNVDFRFDPNRVISAVNEALQAEPIENVALEPMIHCIAMDFKDSYISYAVRYWLTDLGPDDPTNSVVRTRIYAALKRDEILLSIPAQGLFISKDDARHKQEKLDREVAQRMKVLRKVELFASLTDDELKELAEQLRVAPFVSGEAITRQGAEAHWLYVIAKGTATVRVTVDDTGLSKQIATLKAGDYFGEMAMMTGERRSATVIAASDTDCYRIDRQSFESIIRERPEIAEDISYVLANRRVSLEAARDGLNEAAAKRRVKTTQGDLLKRIKKFFSV